MTSLENLEIDNPYICYSKLLIIIIHCILKSHIQIRNFSKTKFKFWPVFVFVCRCLSFLCGHIFSILKFNNLLHYETSSKLIVDFVHLTVCEKKIYMTSGGECSANVSCECAECEVWPNANAANANVDKCECECEYVRVCGHPSRDQ